MKDITNLARSNHGSSLQIDRIKPHVVIHRRNQVRVLRGSFDQSSSFLGIHAKRFFADHVLASFERLLHLLEMKTVRAG